MYLGKIGRVGREYHLLFAAETKKQDFRKVKKSFQANLHCALLVSLGP